MPFKSISLNIFLYTVCLKTHTKKRNMRQDSSVSEVTGCGLARIFLFATTSRQDMGPNQPPLYPTGTRSSFSAGRIMKLTAYLKLVLKLRTHGALPPCSLYIDIHGST
jgi:hypothetical protein